MLKEISKCENFGTPNLILNFLKICNNSKNDIKEITSFYQKSFSYESFLILDTLTLLIFLGFVDLNNDLISITPKGKEIIERDEVFFMKNFKRILCQKYFDEMFSKGIISARDIKYDGTLDKYTIKNSQIPFKYSALKNILLKFKILRLEKDYNLLILEELSLVYVKDILDRKVRKLNLDELKASIQIKEKQGNEAEKFVLNYEKNRLKGHPRLKDIKRVSELDVSAGFDIISLKEESSSSLDLFIEVKSYSETPSFYWSKNEIDVARKKGDDYYMYLVDRDKIEKEGYKPMIIINPYKNIYCDNQWSKETTNWYFSKN